MPVLVTLTTDFGTRDSYVAEMKGVLLEQGPEGLQLLDLSHSLEPFRVREAALFLRAALPRFPAGTVHLVVVDPGVGGERRALAARVGEQWLVGPDNGVFGYLFDGSEQVHEIDPSRLGTHRISRTFHGRDIFAPAAARLAEHRSLEALGPRLDAYEHLVFPMVEFEGDDLHGRVIHIDRFGNLITNISEDQLLGFLADAERESLRVNVRQRTIEGLSGHYAERRVGDLLALVGSAGLLEIAAREDSAAGKLGVEVGEHVRVHR